MQSMGSQRIRHDWVTNWTELALFLIYSFVFFFFVKRTEFLKEDRSELEFKLWNSVLGLLEYMVNNANGFLWYKWRKNNKI